MGCNDMRHLRGHVADVKGRKLENNMHIFYKANYFLTRVGAILWIGALVRAQSVHAHVCRGQAYEVAGKPTFVHI